MRLLLAVVIAIATVIGLSDYARQTGYVANDAAQYIDGAASILSDHEYSTRILYYDEHYGSGSIPAPQTVWPPGVSLSIAVLALTGIPLEDGCRILSLLCYVLLATSTVLAVWYLTKSMPASIAAAIWQFSIFKFWGYATDVGSDLIFTGITTASILLCVTQLHSSVGHDDRPSLSFPALAGLSLLAGVGFVFRYAGVFLIAWVMLLILIEFASRISRRSETVGRLVAKAVCAALPAIIIFAVLIARNFLITGGIRGGNYTPASNPIADSILANIKTLVNLLTGVNWTDFFNAPVVITGIGLLALIVLCAIALALIFQLWRLYRVREAIDWRGVAYIAIGLLVAVYVGGMIALESITPIGFAAHRYMFPVVPAFIILGVALWPYKRSFLIAGIAILAITQTVANLKSADRARYISPDNYAELAAWITENTERHEPIVVIGDGQAIGYYSMQPTLAVPVTRFTAFEWNEERIANTAERYRANILVLGRTDDLAQYEAFATSLLSGYLPEWLEIAQTFDNAIIYRIRR